MKIQVLLVSIVIAVSPLASAQTDITTDEQKFSYSVGFQIGQQLRQRLAQAEMELDAAALVAAIEDVLSGNDPRITTEEMQAVYQAGIAQRQQRQQEIAAKSTEAGNAFLAENKTKDGIVETESGLQYRIVEEGSGKSPAATDTVVVHYEGRLIDGEQFDSSYERGTPATFAVNGIIKGWQEALQLMQEGATWEVYIPAELGYGAQGAPGGGIGPNETLIFKVELIEVKS